MAINEIACILPVYNSEKTVGTVLDCLFASVPAHILLDVVVIDDASTDGTASVCERYPVRLLRQEKNRGPAYCRNLGVRQTEAPVLMFLDADISFDPELLGAMVACLDNNPSLAGVCTLTSPAPLNPSFASRYFALQEYLRFMDIIEDGCDSWSFVSTRCGLLKREVFEENGGFNENFALAAYEDLEFSARMDSRHQLALDPALLVRHYWPGSVWKILKRLHVNARGVMSFSAAMRKKASQPFAQDRDARLLVGVSGVCLFGGVIWQPLWLIAVAAHLGAMYRASWLLRGCLRHEGIGFLLRAWAVYNLTLLPFATGVFMGLLDRVSAFAAAANPS